MIMFRAESKVVVMLGGCLNNDVHLCLDVNFKKRPHSMLLSLPHITRPTLPMIWDYGENGYAKF